MASRAVFEADLEKYNAALQSFGAVKTDAEGFQYIDTDKAPGPLLRSYRMLVQYGFAEGYL